MKNFLPNNLKYLIEKNDRNNVFLARLTKTTKSTVGNYLNGDSLPKVDFLITVSEYFNISCDDLLKKDLSKENASETQENATTEVNSLQQTKDNLFKLINEDIATNKLFHSLISATMIQYFSRLNAIEYNQLSEKVLKELKDKISE